MRKIIGIGILILVFQYQPKAQTWSLQQCIDSAMLNNKKIQVEENNIHLSEEKQKEVRSNLLPKISANGDYKYYTNLPTQLMPLAVFGGPAGMYKEAQFGVNHNLLGNIQVGMPIYNPELYGGLDKVAIAKEMSAIKQKKTKQEIYAQVANAYYNAQVLNSQKEFINKNLENAQRLLETVHLLSQQGVAQQIDVSKVELKISQLQTMKANIEGKTVEVYNFLKFLMGISTEQSFEVDATISYDAQNNDAKLQAFTFDAKLLDTKNRFLSSELTTLKRSRYLPTAMLYGSFGKLGYGYTKPQPIGGDFYNFYNMGFVGAKISIPIFNGMVTNKKINQKRIEIENNNLQKELVEEQNVTLLKNAIQQRETALKAIEDNKNQMAIAQGIYDKVLLQQKQGVASITDVLLADNAINEAQKNYLSAVIDYLKADLEIKKRTGELVKK